MRPFETSLPDGEVVAIRAGQVRREGDITFDRLPKARF